MKYFATAFFFFFIHLYTGAQAPLVKQWDKSYGGDSGDWLSAIQQTKDGGYILGGGTATPGSVYSHTSSLYAINVCEGTHIGESCRVVWLRNKIHFTL